MVRRGFCPSNGTFGFPSLVSLVRHFLLWAARAPGLLMPSPFGSDLSPHSVLTCLPSLLPAEQRCLREHLELVVLHPPHHHRLLFYAEPRAGCAVRVSLCYSPVPLSLVIFFPGRSHRSFVLVLRAENRPLSLLVSKPCTVVQVVHCWGNPVKGLVEAAIQPRLDSPHCAPGLEPPLPRGRRVSFQFRPHSEGFLKFFRPTTHHTEKCYRALLSIIYILKKQ